MLKNLGGGNFEIINNLGNDVSVFRVPVKDFNNDGRDDILTETLFSTDERTELSTAFNFPAVLPTATICFRQN